ncbi:MAG: hypothetical protein MUF87_05740 [Anaerolineae bacterium]|nr:hypothetical protein [Anaerolineae bacterium]
MDNQLLVRGLIAGVALSVLGIGLFAVIWIALAQADTLLRLVAAVCIPPIVLGIGIGGLMMRVRRSSNQDS